MKNVACKLIITMGLVVGLISFNANAGLITYGSWSDILGNGNLGNAVVKETSTNGGQSNNKIYWGSNNEGWNNGKNSSWSFYGVPNPWLGDSDPWVGDDYLYIGTFKHRNNPIYDYDFLGATLDISLNYGGEMSIASLTLGHVETPNWECNPGCADIVTLIDATDSINIGGMWYELMIKGFDQNDRLYTPEYGKSKAHLYLAKIPEPSVIALFGIGLLGLGFATRRKAQG